MIDTKYDDLTANAETQELILGLKSFGQSGEYADPTTDTAFKHLLSPAIEENKEIIKSFLNTFVPDFAHDPEYKTDTIEKEKYATEFASERAKGKAEGKAELLIKQLEAKIWYAISKLY